MALSFVHPDPKESILMWTNPDGRLYLTADGRVVTEGDIDALSLLVGANGRLPLALAVHYGLVAPTAVEGSEG